MHLTREAKKKKTKKAILAAAVELFSINGFEKTSISQLAKTAGVGKGTVYSYFKTKQDLLLAFCEDELEYIHEQLNTRTNQDAPVFEQLVTVFMAEFEYVTRNPEFGRLYMQEIVFPKKLLAEKHKEGENKFFEMIFPILLKGQERGEIRQEFELLHLCGHFFAIYLLLLHAWYSDFIATSEAEAALRTLFTQAFVGLQPSTATTHHAEAQS
ncbi:TetR/AcrR family transcriptional regulator [Desulfopila aestuarii]|uniref:Transcriptional regulator, TetR family n=1 Tax=Desulfopila aestuarii DSM 18488 TaxID=1121416 RepID=A0A1M7YAV8_9BACT|nr:TetR/AcrR family transcriptional regulator [Desulfopila aestuarii]SHO49770.1 transcriptional regulator, TetR family [Desulfopila aestuarii DSM 18488]